MGIDPSTVTKYILHINKHKLNLIQIYLFYRQIILTVLVYPFILLVVLRAEWVMSVCLHFYPCNHRKFLKGSSISLLPSLKQSSMFYTQ